MDVLRENAGPTANASRLVVRGPLVLPTMALAAGCLAGRYFPAPFPLWLTLLGACLLLGVLTFRRDRMRIAAAAAILTAAAALGAMRMHLAWYSVPENHIVTWTDRTANLATVRGRVASVPQIHQPEVEFGYRPEPALIFLLQVEAILTNAGRVGRAPAWRETTGLVRVTVEEPLWPPPRPGDRLEIQGRLGRFARPNNPGQYDASDEARRTGTWVWLRAPAAGCLRVLESPGNFASIALWRYRALVRQHLVETAEPPNGQLLDAMILGRRENALASLNRAMQRAGTAHFLSISGTHLAIFLGFVYFLARLLMLSPRRASVAALAVLGAYLLLAEPSPPLLRSAIMAACLLTGTLTGRSGSSLNALALAATLLLLVDPRQIFQPGFQLSFAIVAGLILLFRPLRTLLFGRWLRRRGLMVFRGSQKIRRWLYFAAADLLIDTATTAVACYLVSAPLAAMYFGLFSPWAIVLNLLLLPLVTTVLVPGYLSAALAWPMPNLAAVFGGLAGRAAHLLTRTVTACEALPALSLPMRPVGVGWVLLCWVTLAAVVFARRRQRRILAGLLAAALLGATVWTQRTARSDEAQLDLLAVGPGQCAVLQIPSGETVLFDAGTRGGFDLHRKILSPFLREMRLPSPRTAFLSHANADHYSALPALAREGALKTLYVSEAFFRPPSSCSESRRLLEQLRACGVSVRLLRRGDSVSLDARTHVDVLWPPEGRTDLTANDTSLVLRVVCDGRGLLLPGDVEKPAQAELLRQPEQLRAETLLLPHHGGWTKTLPDFVRAVDPRFVLLSAGREPTGPASRDGKTARTFYESLSAKYRYVSTPRHGWIRLRFGRGGDERLQSMR